jgi:hypothetical protein
MHTSRRIGLLSCLIGGVLLLLALGANTTAQTADPKGPPDGSAKKPAVGLDKLKLPAGSVIVLVKEQQEKDLANLYPTMVMMRPETYKDMTDRLAQLEKQIKTERKGPHACKLNAFVEGDAVRVVADLYFQTEQPRSSVLLGFKGTQLNEVKVRLQGQRSPWQVPMLDQLADGSYVVQVEKVGDYQLTIELRVPLASASGVVGPGADRSFDLALPGAAVTTLALELAEPVRELRWNKTTEKLPSEQKRWEMALGKITQLQVAWKEPIVGKAKDPIRTVRGQVTVRVEENQILTTAELTLTDLVGKATLWRLWLPPQAKVKVVSPERLAAKGLTQQGPQCWALTLSTPVNEPIKVQVSVVTPRPVAKIGVGPFAVEGASHQEGTIEVKVSSEARRGLRLTPHLVGAIKEVDPPREAGSEVLAVFKYWDMPPTPKNNGAPLPASLEIELKTVQGKVETFVEHTLHLRPGDPTLISATCKIVARAIDTPVDFLDIQLPRIPPEAYPLLLEPTALGFPANVPWASWALASQLPIDGEWVVSGSESSPLAEPASFPTPEAKAQRKLRVRLTQAQAKEFTITLRGTYTLPSGTNKLHLELPRPLGIHDKGAKGTMHVPEKLELLVLDGGPEQPAPQKHHHTRTWDRAPKTWDLAWRPYRREVAVAAITDIAIQSRYAHVQHQFTWDAPLGPDGILRLQVPEKVKGLKVVRGGNLLAAEGGKKQQLTGIQVDPAAKGVLVMEYDFALPAKFDEFDVPLPWPEEATQLEAKLRLWSQPGTLVLLGERSSKKLAWKDIGTEVVPGRDALPARVLQSDNPRSELWLTVKVLAPEALPSLVADRVLIQAYVDEDGTESYRARFLLSQLPATHVDVALPVPLGKQLGLQFVLDGKVITWQPREGDSQVARLAIDPRLYTKPIILEVQYQLSRGQPEPEGWLHTTLNPPMLEGQVVVGQVRWQVVLPQGLQVIAARGKATTEQQWSLEPALTTEELEKWLTGDDKSQASGDSSLVSCCSHLEPLRIFRVPRALWFLVCSGTVLLLALVLYLLPPPPVGWLVIAVLALCAVLSWAWLWPELLRTALFGSVPGLAVLAPLVGIGWMLHQRYKRQLVFMPGFTRVKAGSSLIRGSSVKRNREPSTVDAPSQGEKSDPG